MCTSCVQWFLRLQAYLEPHACGWMGTDNVGCRTHSRCYRSPQHESGGIEDLHADIHCCQTLAEGAKSTTVEWKDQSALFKKGKKLKVAVLWDDGVVKPHPPILRALDEVVSKLKQTENVEIVDWKPYKHDLVWEIIVSLPDLLLEQALRKQQASLYFCDGGREDFEALDASKEPYLPLTDWVLKKNPHVKEHTIQTLWKRICDRDDYRTAYTSVWNETATSVGPNGEPEGMVDVILCPVSAGVASKHDTSKYLCYTSQWNLLDYPAAVFPVSKVDIEKDGKPQEYQPRNEKDAYSWNMWLENGAQGSVDAPISWQLVGRRYEDEKVLRALEAIKESCGLPFVNYV